MRKRKGMYKWLSGLLTTAMLAANMSAAMVSMTALADIGYVNSGPGVQQTKKTAEAADSTLPADSPYKDIPVFVRNDGWVNIGTWKPADIKGVSFEIGCKVDWDGGGGGGIYIDNWDQLSLFSYDTMKNRITYMFRPGEPERLRQEIKLNLWWTWPDGNGNSHLDDVYLKNVRLIVDKEAQAIVSPTGDPALTSAVSGKKGGGGGGGGGSHGGGSGANPSVSVGDNSIYKYIARKEGATHTFNLSDICPGFQNGDIVRITMKTKGGIDIWNNYDLSMYENETEKRVSKPGGMPVNTVTLEGKPDGGNITVAINWLGGDYLLYGFDVSIIGHGEPVKDETLMVFTYEDIKKTEKEPHHYVLDMTEELQKAMDKAVAAGTVKRNDRVTVRVKVDVSDCYKWSTIQLETDGTVSPGSQIKPLEGHIRENVEMTGYVKSGSTLRWYFEDDDTYPLMESMVKKLKEIEIKPLDPYRTEFTSAEASDLGVVGNENGDEYHDYAIDLSNLLQKAIKEQLGANLVLGEDELEITVNVIEENTWTGNGLCLTAADGDKKSDVVIAWETEGNYSGAMTVTGVVTDKPELLLVHMYQKNKDAIGSLKVESIEVSKTGKKIEKPVKTATKDNGNFKLADDNSGNYLMDLTDELKKAMQEANIGANEEVEISAQVMVTATGFYTWNQMQMISGGETVESAVVEPNGTSQETILTLTGTPGTDFTYQWRFQSSNSNPLPDDITAQVKKLTVKPVDPYKTEFTSADAIDLGETENGSPGYRDYGIDLSNLLKKAIREQIGSKARLGRAGDFRQDELEITVKVEEKNTYAWNKLRLKAVNGRKESDEAQPEGQYGGELTVTGNPMDTPELYLVYTNQENADGMGTLTVESINVEKTGNKVMPGLLSISYEDYSKLSTDTSNPNVKEQNVKTQFEEAIKKYENENGEINDGNNIQITAEFDSQGVDWWNFCGNVVMKDEEWGSVGMAEDNKIVWEGTFKADWDFVNIQLGEMQEEGYLVLKSLEVNMPDNEDAVDLKEMQEKALEPEEPVMEDDEAEDGTEAADKEDDGRDATGEDAVNGKADISDKAGGMDNADDTAGETVGKDTGEEIDENKDVTGGNDDIIDEDATGGDDDNPDANLTGGDDDNPDGNLVGDNITDENGDAAKKEDTIGEGASEPEKDERDKAGADDTDKTDDGGETAILETADIGSPRDRRPEGDGEAEGDGKEDLYL